MELGALDASIDELVTVDVSALADEEVRVDSVALRRAIDRLEFVAAQLAARLHRGALGDVDGASSTTAWMQWNTGQRAREAKQSIAAGIALDDLPLVAAAWAAGELSASAARTIARGRHADHGAEYAEVEAALVDLGVHRHFRALDTAIHQYRTHVETEPKVESGLHLSTTPDGWRLDATLDRFTGGIVAAALEAATPPPAEYDDRTPAQRRADALATICRAYLGRLDDDLPASPTNADLVVDWGTYTASMPGLHDTPVPESDLRRLLCDSTITRIITGPDGRPLDVGRTRRLVTTPQRKAIRVRDGHCCFPGCDRPPRWCEIHHVVPWEHGGATDLDNLVMLCSHHHHVVHKPGWSATFDGNEFTVTNPDGRVITQRRAA